MWVIREGVAEASVKKGYTLKYDVSLSGEHYYKLVDEVRNAVRSTDILS
jgi:hypothetical protein